MKTILGIKISRRVLAVTFVCGARFVFNELRHVATRPGTIDRATRHYVRQLLAQFQPSLVAYYAPIPSGSHAAEIVRVLEAEATHVGIPLQRLHRQDVFGTLTVVPVASRRKLHEIAAVIAPFVGPTTNRTPRQNELTLAEAVGAALLGQVWSELPPP